MPGAVPMTSTFALTNATRPYGRKIADLGLAAAVKSDVALARGLNTFDGHITYEAVARDLGYDYLPILEAIDGKAVPGPQRSKGQGLGAATRKRAS